MRSIFMLITMSELLLSALFLLAALFLQAPPLSAHHVVWLGWLAGPLLALSMMGTSMDPDVAKMAQGKNLAFISKHVRLLSI